VFTEDNCPLQANADQENGDRDFYGDACDVDDDNDGVSDGADLCPTDPNDAVGDPCNHDEDGDGVADAADACPLLSNDSTGDPCDPDDDNDGIVDGASLMDEGTLFGEVTRHSIGEAYEFDGDHDFISLPSAEDVQLREGEDLSVFAWVKPTVEKNEVIFQNSYSNSQGYFLIRRRGDGFLGNALAKLQDETHACTVASTSLLPLHQWSHVGFTFDAATQNLAIYVNGVLENQVSCNPAMGNTYANNDFRWGADPSGNS
jgi:hypothetical protein